MGNFNSTPAAPPLQHEVYQRSFSTERHAARDAVIHTSSPPVIIATEKTSQPAQTVDEIRQAARCAAQREWDNMRSSYKASQLAFKSGNGAAAKALSLKGDAHKESAERLEIRASLEIFRKLNLSRPPTEIDLHGQNVDAALELVKLHMGLWRQQGVSRATIIVGR